MSASKLGASVSVLALFGSGLAMGVLAAQQAVPRSDADGFETVARVGDLIASTYVDELPEGALQRGAIEGMVEGLDEHSVWLGEDRWSALQQETQGEVTGIGLEVKLTDGGAVVTRVRPGSPAARDGVKVGDRILTVDGDAVTVSDVQGVRSALNGADGTALTLEVLRGGSATTIHTVRGVVDAPAVRVGWLPEDVLYIDIRRFQKGTHATLEDALTEAQAGRPIAGVVLDLRDNPGGLLDEAVRVVDLFLDDGTIVSTWGRLDAERRSYEATEGSVSAPMTVITNGLSASAAEIVAAALQDTGRATLIGTRTFGKGSVQRVFEHRDGSALKLTVARYYTPSGVPVAPRDGRAPDIEVDWPAVEGPTARLRDAIATLPMQDDARETLQALIDDLPPTEVRLVRSDIPWEAPLTERLYDDPQLAAAYAHLVGH